jgi:transcriptional regulator GlxA family with amidase domain
VSELTVFGTNRTRGPSFDFTVLLLEGAFASSTGVTHDILGAAADLAGRADVAPPRWRMCSIDGGPVRLHGGLHVDTRPLRRSRGRDASVWVIPGLNVKTPAEVALRFQSADALRAASALGRHVAAGGSVAASCSAVFLLQAAGVLERRRATTTWWLAPLLRQMAPRCEVDADRMVCADGPVVTAGAALAHVDLMLHLVRDRCGDELSDLVSRVMLIGGRRHQSSYIVPEMLAGGNSLVARIAEMVESALPRPPSVAALAERLCMSERTLSRHLQKSTGKSTHALVSSVKLRRARYLLEQTRMNVEQIAEAVGYRDATAFRRAMKKRTGSNPYAFRAASRGA